MDSKKGKIKSIKKVRKILIFPSTSNIALEIVNALKYETSFELILASSLPEISPYYLPNINSDNFKIELKKFINNYSIDIIFPAHDLFLDWLADNWGNIQADIVSDYPEQIRKYRSKLQTYIFLRNKVRTPEIISKFKNNKYPIFVKPDKGYGSKNVFLIKNSYEYENIPKDNDFLFLEFLPGKEYTVDCISNREGKLIDFVIRERIFIQSGIARITKIIKDRKDIENFVTRVAELTKLRGAWFLQVKDDNYNIPCLLEIGPRISGNMTLMRANGINTSLLSILILIDKTNIKITKNMTFEYLIRNLHSTLKPKIKLKTLYIEFTDTILINDNINPFAVALISQCRNFDINCILITKHTGNIITILKNYDLLNYFLEVIQLNDLSKDRSNYIKCMNSIYIDNSYTERTKISKELAIPVFSCDMIETLVTHIEGHA